MEQAKQREWFKEWFNTDEYHILYKKRDENEAVKIIDSFTSYLNLHKGAKVLDLACGRGRHSASLSKKGFLVTGLDLSEANVQYARQTFPHIDFFRQDMREPFPVSCQQVVFNFFTSFGYFDTDEEHIVTLQNIYNCLDSEGSFIMDYFNTNLVKNSLIPEETSVIDEISFTIKRFLKANQIVKQIEFEKNGQVEVYFEKVKAFDRAQMEQLLHEASFHSVQCFGDYDLSPYVAEKSPRMIFLARK